MAILPLNGEIPIVGVTILIMNKLLAPLVHKIGNRTSKIRIGISLAPDLHYLWTR
jgi:hypothetical protein